MRGARMKLDRPFRVVTHRNWLAEHFKEYGAVQDFGFDIDPDTAESAYWWAPGAWVACAWQSGVRLPLLLCGHRWMEDLPYEYKERDIAVRKIEDIEDAPDAGEELVHVKLPEAKLDSFPASVFHASHLGTSLKQFWVPKGTLLQLSEVVHFVRECRFWMCHGVVTAHSWYLVDGMLWDHPDFKGDAHYDSKDHTYLDMADLAEDVAANVACPPGFTIDMGLTDDGRILVVETNASWSSSPYNGDPEGIIDSIAASHDFDNEYPQWRWRPNPVYGIVQPLKWAEVINGGRRESS
jgi:hypothetical protein